MECTNVCKLVRTSNANAHAQAQRCRCCAGGRCNWCRGRSRFPVPAATLGYELGARVGHARTM
eukprot:1832936-Alexandrium_andersonii.AAC.1